MEALRHLDAVAVPIARPNIDTDQIIPARFLLPPARGGPCGLPVPRRPPPAGQRGGEPGLPAEPAALARRPGSIVAGRNFACGSSRESAVWALFDDGFRCVIAPSFGDIFQNNGFKNGLLPVRAAGRGGGRRSSPSWKPRPAPRVSVDLPSQTVTFARRHDAWLRHRPLRQALPAEGPGRARPDPVLRGGHRRLRTPLRPGEYPMRIAVLPGDGIGQEVTAQAVKVLRAALGQQRPAIRDDGGAARRLRLRRRRRPAAGRRRWRWRAAPRRILFGAAGTYESDLRPPESRGGHGLLRLRKALDLFANFRPVYAFPELLGASSLRREVIEGVDLVVLRELTSDIYFGDPARHRPTTPRPAQRLQHHALHRGRDRPHRPCRLPGRRAAAAGKLCSVDKANVLETSVLWREVVGEVGPRLPGCGAARTSTSMPWRCT